MKKIIIKLILILLIISMAIICYKISFNTKKGTIEAFCNIDYRDISYVICDNLYVNTDEFIGIYWYKVFKKTKYDKSSYPIKKCKCYNNLQKEILEIIEFNNNSYYFSNQKTDISKIKTVYYITK